MTDVRKNIEDQIFLLTPLREGRPGRRTRRSWRAYFYSRPCGRGDELHIKSDYSDSVISTHAPAGGATYFYSVSDIQN